MIRHINQCGVINVDWYRTEAAREAVKGLQYGKLGTGPCQESATELRRPIELYATPATSLRPRTGIEGRNASIGAFNERHRQGNLSRRAGTSASGHVTVYSISIQYRTSYRLLIQYDSQIS